MSQWTHESVIQWINASMHQQINESMTEWTDDSMNQWTDDSMYQWINDSAIRWMNPCINELAQRGFSETVHQWVSEAMSQWVNRPMNRWFCESMKQCTSKSMNHWLEWTDGSINQWTNKPVSQFNESLNRWFSEFMMQWFNESMNQWINESILLEAASYFGYFFSDCGLSCLPASSSVASATQFFSSCSCYIAFGNLQLQSRIARSVACITHALLRAAVPMRFVTTGCKPAWQECRNKSTKVRAASTVRTWPHKSGAAPNASVFCIVGGKSSSRYSLEVQTELLLQSDSYLADLIFQKCSERLFFNILKSKSSSR